MEKLLNHYDKEYMKLAMLKHEETFRHQVCELHRLYRIQKILMKDIAENARSDPHYAANPSPGECPNPTGPVGEFNVRESEDDQSDILELTLGPRSYHQKKIKASEPPELPSDSGTSFSSSSTGSSHIVNGKRKELLFQNKYHPDRLNRPPWLLQASSLNLI